MRWRAASARASAATVASVVAALLSVTPAAFGTGDPGDAGQPVLLSYPMRGTAAVQALGGRLDTAARRSGMTAAAMQRILQTDHTAVVDVTGHLKYAEAAPADTVTASPEPAAGSAPYALSDTFQLHSRAGAPRVLYLDFDGYDVSGTVWDASTTLPTSVAAFDTDGSASTFGDAERATIQRVWQSVAEDFAPFDVDVTTEQPSAAALDRTDSSDDSYGATAVITSDVQWNANLCGGCSGEAYVGVLDDAGPGHRYYQPAIVLARSLDGDARWIAQSTAHELGHIAGLSHDGVSGSEYYGGVSGGLWAPIMGASFGNPVTQWSKGEYAGATNTQDDFAVMAGHGLPLRPDEAGGDPGTAAAVAPGDRVSGVVAAASDTDWYRVDWPCTGALTATAHPAAYEPDLDVVLSLRDASGDLVTASSPATTRVSPSQAGGLDAAVGRDVGPGTYYLEVDGGGSGTWGGGGFSDYASVGAYHLAVGSCTDAVPLTSTATPPGPPRSVTATSGRRGGLFTVHVSWRAPAADGGAAIRGYRVRALRLHDGRVVSRLSTATLSAGARSATLSLRRGSYRMQVSAVNRAGWSAWSLRTAAVRAL